MSEPSSPPLRREPHKSAAPSAELPKLRAPKTPLSSDARIVKPEDVKTRTPKKPAPPAAATALLLLALLLMGGPACKAQLSTNLPGSRLVSTNKLLVQGFPTAAHCNGAMWWNGSYPWIEANGTNRTGAYTNPAGALIVQTTNVAPTWVSLTNANYSVYVAINANSANAVLTSNAWNQGGSVQYWSLSALATNGAASPPTTTNYNQVLVVGPQNYRAGIYLATNAAPDSGFSGQGWSNYWNSETSQNALARKGVRWALLNYTSGVLTERYTNTIVAGIYATNPPATNWFLGPGASSGSADTVPLLVVAPGIVTRSQTNFTAVSLPVGRDWNP